MTIISNGRSIEGADLLSRRDLQRVQEIAPHGNVAVRCVGLSSWMPVSDVSDVCAGIVRVFVDGEEAGHFCALVPAMSQQAADDDVSTIEAWLAGGADGLVERLERLRQDILSRLQAIGAGQYDLVWVYAKGGSAEVAFFEGGLLSDWRAERLESALAAMESHRA